MSDLMLGHRKGPSERELEEIAAVRILDARASHGQTPSGRNHLMAHRETHHWKYRVHSAVARFSYRVGVFRAARAKVMNGHTGQNARD